MKIKLAILEKDEVYLNRIVLAFNTKYPDKFEIYSFTDQKIAIDNLEKSRIEVFLASDTFEFEIEKLPKRCGFAYLVDSSDIETKNDKRAICKFQKIDLIYKQILSIYSENEGKITGIKENDETCKILSFLSAGGGVGSSTLAASCAIHFASQDKKVMYLNLEKLGSSNSYFSGEGQFSMSDIIFALKSRKSNMSLKLESCVKEDKSGVFFYSETNTALDMLELNNDDINLLISELKLLGSYDYIIIDLDFSFDKSCLELLKKSRDIVFVGDGQEISNLKLYRAFKSLRILDENSDSNILNRVSVAYNKFSNKSSKTISDDLGITCIGGAPKYENATTSQVLQQLSSMSLFDKLI